MSSALIFQDPVFPLIFSSSSSWWDRTECSISSENTSVWNRSLSAAAGFGISEQNILVTAHFLLKELGVKGIHVWCIFGVTLGSFDQHLMDYKKILCCFVTEHNFPGYFCICCREGPVAVHKFMNQPRAEAIVISGECCHVLLMSTEHCPGAWKAPVSRAALGLGHCRSIVLTGAFSTESLHWLECHFFALVEYSLQPCAVLHKWFCKCLLQLAVCFLWLIAAISWPIWPISRGFSWM